MKKAEYKVGQVWKLVGSISDVEEEKWKVVHIKGKYITCENCKSGKIYTFEQHGIFADCGTPDLSKLVFA